MTSTDIRLAGAEDVEAVGDVLADAFQEPVTRWLVPDAAARPAIMSRFFTLVAEDALKAGNVYVIGDYAGAALWFDETGSHGEAPTAPEPGSAAGDGAAADEPDTRYQEVFGEYAPRWDALESIMTLNHPDTAPHHYLMVVGVRTAHQGRGLGAALIEAHHREIADAALPAYLEATSLDSRRLYQRLGYQDLGSPLQIPDGPPMFPMWRPAVG